MLTQSETNKAEPRGYCPPVLFWIAEYVDGSCLCQFDPDTGQEALFKHVDQTRLRSFGWYPVTRKLADLVKTPQLRVNPLLHTYRLELGPGQHLIAHKQQKIHCVSAQVCFNCGHIWQFREKPGELNYSYSDMKVEMTDKGGRRYVTPQCPKCSAYTHIVCEKCAISRSRYVDGYRCAECQTNLPDQTRAVDFEEQKQPNVYWDIENLGRVDIPSGSKFKIGTLELLMRDQKWTMTKEGGWTISGTALEQT